jgi:hypothetical protein
LDEPLLSHKAKPPLGENPNRRNNAVHSGRHWALGDRRTMDREIMKTLFEKGVLA